MSNLPDVQLTKPQHEIAINKVGIKNLLLPIFITQQIGGYQHTTAKIDCMVNLESHLKGINMSRIPRSIHTFLDKPLNASIINEISEDVRNKSEAESCELIYRFPFFIKKLAPESKEPGLVNYSILFNGIKTKNEFIFKLGVNILATNLCPCSKEISSYGAHNQRINIHIECQPKINKWVWLEEIIALGESSTSCEIYSILKREDERKVTELAYENPMFVEDVVRSCYDKLSKIENIETFKVEATAEESIHLHNAFASITNY